MLSTLDTGSTASYQYDGLNRRIVRTEGSGTTHFYYNNQWQVLEETDGTGASTAIYSYNPEYVDSVAVRMTPTSGHFYTHDALFNVTSMVDEATDSVVERYAYTPYGEATVLDASFAAISGNTSAFNNELLYTGRRIDPATGLQLNRNRFYHQQLGRWVNRDPIGYYGSPFNLYEYVFGMPTYGTDPYGLDGPFGPIYIPKRPIWPQPDGYPTPPGGPEDGPGYKKPLRCTGADSCDDLDGKIKDFQDAINAHKNWDKMYHPGRHAQEIGELEKGLQRCRRIHGDKCKKKKKKCPVPPPPPRTIVTGYPGQGLEEGLEDLLEWLTGSKIDVPPPLLIPVPIRTPPVSPIRPPIQQPVPVAVP